MKQAIAILAGNNVQQEAQLLVGVIQAAERLLATNPQGAVDVAAAADNVIVWDTVTAANMTTLGSGRRIAPPIQRVSGVEHCVEINAEFTSGIGVMNGLSTGTSYIYWRELGGYR